MPRAQQTRRRTPAKNHKPKSRAKKPRFTAKNADKHVLYQLSVQAPDLVVVVVTPRLAPSRFTPRRSR